MFFTDDDQANTAIDEMKKGGFDMAGYEPLKIEGVDFFRAILLSVQEMGDTHVALDLSLKTSKGTFETIQTLLDGLPR